MSEDAEAVTKRVQEVLKEYLEESEYQDLDVDVADFALYLTHVAQMDAEDA